MHAERRLLTGLDQRGQQPPLSRRMAHPQALPMPVELLKLQLHQTGCKAVGDAALTHVDLELIDAANPTQSRHSIRTGNWRCGQETALSVGTPDLTEESPVSKEVERPCDGMSGPEYREWVS